VKELEKNFMKTNKLKSIDEYCNQPRSSFKKLIKNGGKIHGNTKIRNIITGQKDRTMAQWRRQAEESATRLIKAFKHFDVADGL
jgi:hypothetical protein